jgi:hypothetical protein
MTFAIWYETVDLNVVAGAINASTAPISQADKNLAKKYWQGGIDGWATAPLGHHPNDLTAPLARQLVCTFGTLVEFRALLDRVADALGGDALYLHSLAADMGNWWGGQDPFP